MWFPTSREIYLSFERLRDLPVRHLWEEPEKCSAPSGLSTNQRVKLITAERRLNGASVYVPRLCPETIFMWKETAAGKKTPCLISAKEAPRKTPRWGYEPFLWVWSAERRSEPASSSLDHRGFKMTGLCEPIFIHGLCLLTNLSTLNDHLEKNLEFIWRRSHSASLSRLCRFYSHN